MKLVLITLIVLFGFGAIHSEEVRGYKSRVKRQIADMMSGAPGCIEEMSKEAMTKIPVYYRTFANMILQLFKAQSKTDSASEATPKNTTEKTPETTPKV